MDFGIWAWSLSLRAMGSGLLWLRGWDLGWKGKNNLNRVMRVFYCVF